MHVLLSCNDCNERFLYVISSAYLFILPAIYCACHAASQGEAGYIRIPRGNNQCGIVTLSPTYPTVQGADLPPDLPNLPDPPSAGSRSGSCPPSYTVVTGDDMFKIAGRFQVNFLTLWAANPQISNPDLIQPEQVLNIPCPPVRACRASITVQPGQSLWTISQQYGVDLQTLLDANPQVRNAYVY
jgi:LysM repeat protein